MGVKLEAGNCNKIHLLQSSSAQTKERELTEKLQLRDTEQQELQKQIQVQIINGNVHLLLL